MLKRGILFIVSFFVFFVVTASEDDSTAVINKKPPIVYFNEDCGNFLLQDFIGVDTSLNDFHYYAGGLKDGFQSLGNTSSPSKTLLYKIADGVGFGLGIGAFSAYLPDPLGVRYYHVRRPYTKLHYIMGAKAEQFVNVLHTQNISKQFNFGIDFTKSDAPDIFTRHKTNRTNLQLHNNYRSKNKRYALLSNFMYDQLGAEESGGLLNDLALANNDLLFKEDLSATLSNADHAFSNKSAYVKHFLNFGKKRTILPKGDTIPRFEVMPSSRISHSFHYSDQYHRYKDTNPDSLFYSTLFNYGDSLPLYDSIFLMKIENRLSWETLPTKQMGDSMVPRLLNAGIHLRHQYLDYWQNDLYTAYRNYVAGGNITVGKSSGLEVFAKGEYVFAGNDAGDYSAAAGLGYNTGNWYAKLKGDYLLIGADFVQGTWSSDYLDWSNDLDKVMPMAAELEIGSEKYHFYLRPYYAHIKRFVYFDNYAKPQQLINAVDVFRISAGKKFRFKNLHFDADVHYQKNALADVIRLPEWMAYGSVYYENYVFAHKLLLRIGADAHYNTSFLADAWMPATRQFYLQNEQTTGNKPYIDAWIAIKIKRARLYFKASHLNVSSAGYDYNMTPYYPMQEMSFRFGVDWVFYN